MWVQRIADKRRRDEVASIHLELLLRNNEKNRWVGRNFEFSEQKANISTESNKQKLEIVCIAENSDGLRLRANIPIVYFNEDDIAKKENVVHPSKSCDKKTKTIEVRSRGKSQKLKCQLHVRFKNSDSQGFGYSDFTTTEDMSTQQSKSTNPEENFPDISKITKRFGLLFAGEKIVTLKN